jgi:glucose-1-phosphate adenylyltransferase
MEMLEPKNRNALFDYEGRHIFTNRRDSLPVKYGKKAEIKNSIVADGCQIDGTVIDSVICRNVRIREGAVVKNCILEDETTVGANSMLDYIITDRFVIVSEHRSMIGSNTYPVYIERARII